MHFQLNIGIKNQAIKEKEHRPEHRKSTKRTRTISIKLPSAPLKFKITFLMPTSRKALLSFRAIKRKILSLSREWRVSVLRARLAAAARRFSLAPDRPRHERKKRLTSLHAHFEFPAGRTREKGGT